jgi:hypothetical protein
MRTLTTTTTFSGDDVQSHEYSMHEIQLDLSCQSRAALDEQAIAKYAELATDQTEWPFADPLHCVVVGDKTCLVNGHHRLKALQDIGWEHGVRIQYVEGTEQDAIASSVTANLTHGVGITDADKRRLVELAINNPEIAKSSDRQIAELCRVSNRYVGEVRGAANCDRVTVGRSETDDNGEPRNCVPATVARSVTTGADGRKRPANKKAREQQREQIRDAIKNEPVALDHEIAKLIGCSRETVRKVRKQMVASKTTRDSSAKVPVVTQPNTPGLDSIVQAVDAETKNPLQAAVRAIRNAPRDHATVLVILNELVLIESPEEIVEALHMHHELPRPETVKPKGEGATDEEFDALWWAYACRPGVKDACQAVDRHIEAIRQVGIETVIGDMERYCKYRNKYCEGVVVEMSNWLDHSGWDNSLKEVDDRIEPGPLYVDPHADERIEDDDDVPF